MLLKRLAQFLMVYTAAAGGLLLLKYGLQLSDYVIPGLTGIGATARQMGGHYFFNTLNTLAVAILGHALAIGMATLVGILGRRATWLGSTIKTAAYNIQAYPVVALAPIFFILLGDGLLTRLIIAALICYFPLLLSIIGILSEPVTPVEHFFRQTGRMHWRLEIKIRAFENIHKLGTVISGSATLAMVGTIVAEFIAADAGIGFSIRIAMYQGDLGKILVALFFIGILTCLYVNLLEGLGQLLGRLWGGRYNSAA